METFLRHGGTALTGMLGLSLEIIILSALCMVLVSMLFIISDYEKKDDIKLFILAVSTSLILAGSILIIVGILGYWK